MTVDIEYKYPFTAPDFGELEGIAHRGCFDLTQHQEHSGNRLDYFDQELQLKLKAEGKSEEEVKQKSRYIPNVIEPASGLTRAVLVLLCEGYAEDTTRPSTSAANCQGQGTVTSWHLLAPQSGRCREPSGTRRAAVARRAPSGP